MKSDPHVMPPGPTVAPLKVEIIDHGLVVTMCVSRNASGHFVEGRSDAYKSTIRIECCRTGEIRETTVLTDPHGERLLPGWRHGKNMEALGDLVLRWARAGSCRGEPKR